MEEERWEEIWAKYHEDVRTGTRKAIRVSLLLLSLMWLIVGLAIWLRF